MNVATQDMGLMADGAFTALGPKKTEATIIWPSNIYGNQWLLRVVDVG